MSAPVRKIHPVVKANGFEFQIRELVATQKVQRRNGVGIQEAWRLIGVFDSHVGAKNALAKLEQDERVFFMRRDQVQHLCAHQGTLDHKVEKAAAVDPIERAKILAIWDLRTERARQIPCLRCYTAMETEKGATPEEAAAVWHGVLNAPPERVVVEQPKTGTSADCPERCAQCGTRMREHLVPGQEWHPCESCGGSLCESCCGVTTRAG